MPEEREFQLTEDLIPAQDERRGFAPEEMVACEGCQRSNPPTRMSCLYCGESLPVTDANAALRRPALRTLEEWEHGHNIILLPREDGPTSPRDLADAASLLRIEQARLEEIVRAHQVLPVARTATMDEAALIAERLAAHGFRVEIITDEELAAESRPPLRVRRLELNADGIKALTVGGGTEEFAWEDVALIVVGRIFTTRIEIEERRGRAKRGQELADAREMVTDEAALELYSAHDATGWRIMAGNFDYACLGARKGLLASENFKTLVTELRARAPRARFDNGYERLRRLLDEAWPPDERQESGGIRRERPGKFNTEAVTVASNDTQFTRYARMRRLLDAKRQADGKE